MYCKNVVVFNVIRVRIVYVTIKVGVTKHSWTSWPRPLLLCPYEAFSKVGDYDVWKPRSAISILKRNPEMNQPTGDLDHLSLDPRPSLFILSWILISREPRIAIEPT